MFLPFPSTSKASFDFLPLNCLCSIRIRRFVHILLFERETRLRTLGEKRELRRIYPVENRINFHSLCSQMSYRKRMDGIRNLAFFVVQKASSQEKKNLFSSLNSVKKVCSGKENNFLFPILLSNQVCRITPLPPIFMAKTVSLRKIENFRKLLNDFFPNLTNTPNIQQHTLRLLNSLLKHAVVVALFQIQRALPSFETVTSFN